MILVLYSVQMIVKMAHNLNLQLDFQNGEGKKEKLLKTNRRNNKHEEKNRKKSSPEASVKQQTTLTKSKIFLIKPFLSTRFKL